VDAPAHELGVEIDMEALVAARRAGGAALVDLVAARCAEPLTALGEVVVRTDDGAVVLLGAPGREDDLPRRPAAAVALGAVAARPSARGGAVTVRHLAPLSLRVAAGHLDAAAAASLLATLRARLEATDASAPD
jgi:pyruvate dehydrogenase E1 component beta subunit